MSGNSSEYITGNGIVEPPRGVLVPIDRAFEILRDRQVRERSERHAVDLDGTVHFRKVDDGMWLSKRAWGILRGLLMSAEYSRNGGIRLPQSREDERLCHLHDMVESSGMEMERLC
jgi:hypothetical protein